MRALTIFLFLVCLLFLSESADPMDCWDNDGDEYNDMTCGGEDCDDDSSDDQEQCITCTCGVPQCSLCARCINPNAEEVCDSIDNDCDGIIPPDEIIDEDEDDFQLCEDCNDTDPCINPGSAEVCCNSIDDNCDAQIDEGCGYCCFLNAVI